MFQRGDFIKEGSTLGLVVTCGPKTFDVVWIGGSTSRYRHGVRDIRIAHAKDMTNMERDHLVKHAEEIAKERAPGAVAARGGFRVKRGQVWPSR